MYTYIYSETEMSPIVFSATSSLVSIFIIAAKRNTVTAELEVPFQNLFQTINRQKPHSCRQTLLNWNDSSSRGQEETGTLATVSFNNQKRVILTDGLWVEIFIND